MFTKLLNIIKKNKILTYMFNICALLAIFYMFSFIFGSKETQISYSKFLNMVDDGSITKVTISGDNITADVLNSNQKYKVKAIDDPGLVERMHESNVEFQKVEDNSSGVFSLLKAIISICLPVFLIFWLLSKLMYKNLPAQSAAYNKVDPNNLVNSFDDVAGQDEAKEQLKEIIDFIHNPEKYHKIGAKFPKGALLIGPPGTGKTLMAKAMAGEANVPFFFTSGSDFVELYVGVGAKRIRDLFKEAKNNAPCIIFIDEVDSIAKNRNTNSVSGSGDEREQTLNQLLSEIDGFDPYSGIIVIAATNRPETLDKAFTRAGRFDRKIVINAPDLQERYEILKVHSKGVKMDNTVDLKEIARNTAGTVGSDLANIINEAAIHAIQNEREIVSHEDIINAIEFVIAGAKKKSKILSQEEKEIVAYHELGHALIASIYAKESPIQKITIIPRTNGSLGYTMQIPEGDNYLVSKDKMISEIKTLVAGRCAEEIKFNSITTGAANDIQKATEIARDMITLYGMNDKIGMVGISSYKNQYLGNEIVNNASPLTSSIIDKEINKLISSSYESVKNILLLNIDLLDECAEVLLRKETITGDEFSKLISGKIVSEKKDLANKKPRNTQEINKYVDNMSNFNTNKKTESHVENLDNFHNNFDETQKKNHFVNLDNENTESENLDDTNKENKNSKKSDSKTKKIENASKNINNQNTNEDKKTTIAPNKEHTNKGNFIAQKTEKQAFENREQKIKLIENNDNKPTTPKQEETINVNSKNQNIENKNESNPPKSLYDKLLKNAKNPKKITLNNPDNCSSKIESDNSTKHETVTEHTSNKNNDNITEDMF